MSQLHLMESASKVSDGVMDMRPMQQTLSLQKAMTQSTTKSSERQAIVKQWSQSERSFSQTKGTDSIVRHASMLCP